VVLIFLDQFLNLQNKYKLTQTKQTIRKKNIEKITHTDMEEITFNLTKLLF